MGVTRADPIDRAMREAVEQGVFPGAVVLAQVDGRLRVHRAVGRTASPPNGVPTTTGTIYDLASLTKPLATASGLLVLIQDGRLTLDLPVGAVLDELEGSPVGAVTIRQLLAHRSGLPAWRPYYERVVAENGSEEFSRDSARRHVLSAIGREPLDCEPGTTRIYSDVGFMVLGMVIERITDMPLDRFCEARIFRPLGARPLGYFPRGDRSASSLGGEWIVAPTEQEPWRGRRLCGEVHDNNAYALGGVAGHAGLFGTAVAVATVAQAWLDAVHARNTFFDPALAQEFVGWPSPDPARWTLGWDTPTPPSSSGRYFSSRSFGHLGFTGTSLWIDPSREVVAVLLSNRVYPTSTNDKIRAFRPVVHDLIHEHLRAAHEREEAI